MSDSIKKYHEMMEDENWTADSTGYSHNNLPKDPIVERVINKFKSRSRDGIIKYGAVVLKRSYTSVRSPFYYKYKKYYRNLVTPTANYSFAKNNFHKSIYNLPNVKVDTYQNDKIELIEKELNKLCWYDKKIFELYYGESNTLDSLAKKTGISRNSLFTTIDKVRNILKEELLDE